MFWSRVIAFCSGPRAALAGYLAALATFAIVFAAEIPLLRALEAAVVSLEASPMTPPACAAGGLAPEGASLESFDGRWGGYSAEEGRRILCAMGVREGAAGQIYLTRHFPLDMVYPAIYGPALAVIWGYLLGAYGLRRPVWRWLGVAPLLAAGVDYAENLSVRALVLAGPDVSGDAIEAASTLTRLKYGFLAVVLVPALVLLTLHLVRRAR